MTGTRPILSLAFLSLLAIACGGSDGDDPDAATAICGDGVVDTGEECDDGNTTDGDGCAADCSNEPAVCGDGVIQVGEGCDDGAGNSDTDPDACRTDCQAAACGDGVIDSNETCDDGPLNSDTAPDACRTRCQPASCGDGAIDTGETCDDGTQSNADSCLDGPGGGCLPARCGDGYIDAANEGCDDGNNDRSDDCPDGVNGTCQPAVCGDGIVLLNTAGTPEECDDGNAAGGDGCAADCSNEVAPACGDGILQAGEDCDDGNAANDDNCLQSCVFARCGDGFVNSLTEGCDDGNGVLADGCPDGVNGTCQPAACGDGFVYLPGYGGTEACDDGNAAAGDGCDAACALELLSCGDGILDPGEECDLGAANSDTESGACPTTCRSSCACPSCGDGVVDYALGEECDDWNNLGGDGCGTACTLEPIATCGDGSVDIALGEQCDDGNAANGDGCSATCQFETLGLTCGNGAVDGLEICDDSRQCADGTPCTDDTICMGLSTPPFPDNLCLPRNGDGCNTTCNLYGDTTFYLQLGMGVVTMIADDTYLWVLNENQGLVGRVHIQNCIAALQLGQQCAAETVLTGMQGAANPATDGNKLWFSRGQFNVEGPYLMELDIAACESAGLPCNGVEQIGAGTMAWGGHSDGIGTGAAISGLRGLTYYAGYVYFVDGGLGTLRRYDPVTASVLTLVGPPNPAGPSPMAVEGYGNAARLRSPRYMATDNSGFMYISDNFDQKLYRYNVVTGYLDAWIGDGTVGYLDAHDGANAQLDRPRDLISDGTSVYWAAFNSYTIRQVEIASKRVTTLVGQPNMCGDVEGVGAVAALGKPFGMAYHYPTGSLFFSSGADPFTPGCTNLPPRVWRIE